MLVPVVVVVVVVVVVGVVVVVVAGGRGGPVPAVVHKPRPLTLANPCANTLAELRKRAEEQESLGQAHGAAHLGSEGFSGLWACKGSKASDRVFNYADLDFDFKGPR